MRRADVSRAIARERDVLARDLRALDASIGVTSRM
jgi:hypothetical protein